MLVSKIPKAAIFEHNIEEDSDARSIRKFPLGIACLEREGALK